MSENEKDIDELEQASKSIEEQLKKIESQSSKEVKKEPISEEKVQSSQKTQFEKKECNFKRFDPDDPDADFKFKFDTSKTEYTYLCFEHFKEFIEGKPANKSLLEFLQDFYELIPITQKGLDYLTELGYYAVPKKIEPKKPIAEDQSIKAIKESIKKILKKSIILRQKDLEDSIKKSDEFKNIRIGSALNSAIEILKTEDIILDIDLDSKDFVKYQNFIELKGFDKRSKKFYALKKEFERDFEKLKTKETEVYKGTKATEEEEEEKKPKKKKKEETEETKEDIPLTEYACSVDENNEQKFPNLQGIYNHFKKINDYFISKFVFINESLLRKMLLAIERDTPFILYGEPGDGKSLILKTLLDYVCFEYNGGENKIEGKDFTTPINPNIKGKLGYKYGNNWESMNVDESTNPLTLFGGYSPESIGGEKSDRKKTTDLGIISICVRDGKYCLLDEMNRTENEVLGRLMGFLQEPYSYKVPEGNFKFILKNPNSNDPRFYRSNFLLVATMNIGDVGNFKMSFAFKRRFKIIQVHYSTQEIINIIRNARGWSENDLKIISNKWSPLQSSGSDFITLKSKFETMLDDISQAIFDKTHEWKSNRFVTFGVGVAHIMTVLADLALFIQDLILRKYADQPISFIGEAQFIASNDQGDLFKAITDAVDENIIMSLVDENDRYKLEQLNGLKGELINSIFTSVSNVIIWINNNISDDWKDQKISENSIFQELIALIFKWSKIKFEI